MLNQEPQVANEAPAGAPVLALTDNAAAKVLELAKGETNPLIGLRVYIVSGGCSGYRYGMMLDDVENPGDSVFMAGYCAAVHIRTCDDRACLLVLRRVQSHDLIVVAMH